MINTISALVLGIGFFLPVASGAGGPEKPALQQFSNQDFFSPEFWQKLVTTTIGVFLGVVGSFCASRLIERKKRRREMDELVDAVKAALDKNLSIVQHLTTQFSSSNQWCTPLGTPLGTVDLTILDATSVRKYDLLHDIAAARAIDDARFRLIQLNATLQLLRNTTPLAIKNSEVSKFHAAVRASVVEQLPAAKAALESALKSLGK